MELMRRELRQRLMRVLKSDGRVEDFQEDKLVRILTLAGAPSPELVIRGLGTLDGEVPSSLISDKVQLIMLNLAIDDLRWHDAARNYLLWSIYKQSWGKPTIRALNEGIVNIGDVYVDGFKSWFMTGLRLGIWDREMAEWYGPHVEELAEALRPERDLLLTYNGVRTLMSRYLLRRLDSSFFEVPQYMWMRAAMGVAYSELRYGGDPVTWAKRFYDLMSELRFIPNSPTLYNAMTRLGQLSACFVIPVDDCLAKETNQDDPECGFGIMDSLRLAALIFQSGGGVGYNFGKLRPEGDIVRSTTGIASGPLSFMRLFDTLVDTIKQGGKRRGAQMGMLFWWHPDIEKFITSKSGESRDTALQNFNISVAIDDFFMRKALAGEDVYLINPRECPCLYKTWGQEFVKCYESCVERIREVRIWRRINAGELWKRIVRSAWDSGDPGLWNRELSNLVNNERLPGEVINATNPCSEESLYDFESCNLGSINLAKYASSSIDWVKLAEDVKLAVRFLDDVIDVNKLPSERLRARNLETRRIGLGVNGLADLLIKLGIRYDSPEAIALSDKLAEFVSRVAVRASVDLAKERGVYPAYKHSDWARGILPWRKHMDRLLRLRDVDAGAIDDYLAMIGRGDDLVSKADELIRELGLSDDELARDVSMIGVRNGSILSIAPEGSRSLIAGVNSSIEPLFAVAYVRNLTIGKLVEYNLTALRLLRERGALDPETRRFIEETGHLPPGHPLANILRTAHEIHWRWHIYMQVTWARWNDSGVSKTINMPAEATVKDVEDAYRLAWLLGAFGITVYRDRSKSVQVIYAGVKDAASLTAIKDKLSRLKSSEPIEEEMRRELGEGEDPYCRTGSCN